MRPLSWEWEWECVVVAMFGDGKGRGPETGRESFLGSDSVFLETFLQGEVHRPSDLYGNRAVGYWLLDSVSN